MRCPPRYVRISGRVQVIEPPGGPAAQIRVGHAIDPGQQVGGRCLVFDAVFTAARIRIIKTPVQAPRANAICERWIASARRECTDRILIASGRHLLHHILSEYVDHYNTHRPHRALSQRPSDPKIPAAPAADDIRVRRRDRLGGLIHEYSQVA